MRKVDKYNGVMITAAFLAAGCETKPAPVAPAVAPSVSVVKIEAGSGAPSRRRPR